MTTLAISHISKSYCHTNSMHLMNKRRSSDRIASMKTATLTTRVDPEIKAQAEATVAPLGLTLSQAVNVFLHRLVLEGGFPFDVRQPRYNEETEAAIAEGKAILAGTIPATSYASFDALINDLGD